MAPSAPGSPNRHLRMTRNDSPFGERQGPPSGVPVAVVPLVPGPLAHWAGLVAGRAGTRFNAFVPAASPSPTDSPVTDPHTPAERLKIFRATASPTARKLAGYLAACPVLTLPVMRLIQHSAYPPARTDHLAEVLLGGLLRGTGEPEEPDEPDLERYEFRPGVRESLLDSVPSFEVVRVLDRVSEFEFCTFLGLKVTANAAGPTPPDFFEGVPTQ